MATKISKIVVALEGAAIEVNGLSYKVSQGALYDADGEKLTPRKLGTTWSEIFEMSGINLDPKKSELASSEDIIEEVKNTKVDVPENKDDSSNNQQDSKQDSQNDQQDNRGRQPRKEIASDANLEYYTTPGQKAALAPIYEKSDNKTAQMIMSYWKDEMDRATVVRVNRDQVLELDEVFKAALETGEHNIPSRTLNSLKAKHVALSK